MKTTFYLALDNGERSMIIRSLNDIWNLLLANLQTFSEYLPLRLKYALLNLALNRLQVYSTLLMASIILHFHLRNYEGLEHHFF